MNLPVNEPFFPKFMRLLSSPHVTFTWPNYAKSIIWACGCFPHFSHNKLRLHQEINLEISILCSIYWILLYILINGKGCVHRTCRLLWMMRWQNGSKFCDRYSFINPIFIWYNKLFQLLIRRKVVRITKKMLLCIRITSLFTSLLSNLKYFHHPLMDWFTCSICWTDSFYDQYSREV